MRKLKNTLGDVGYVLETFIILVFYSLLGVQFYVKYWLSREEPIEIEFEDTDDYFSEYEDPETGFIHIPQYININTASSLELQELDGIGEGRAKAIIEYREEHGDFTDIEQVTEVYGISEKIFEQFRDRITV